MRLARRIVLAVLVTVTLGSWANAQVMSQVPANAALVIKIKALDATNQKFINFFNAIGVSQDAPGLGDPMAFILAQAKIPNGINKSGDFAFVILDPGPQWNWDQAPLMLVPVSDYQAFIGNFPDAKTDGAVTSATIGGSPQPSYIAHWGDYAAMSPNKDNVATPPAATLTVTGASAPELDSRDIVVLANLKVFGNEVLPAIEQGRTMAMAAISQQASNPQYGKYAPALKSVVNQFLNIPKALFTDCDVISLGIDINPDGITTALIADFHAGSYMGNLNGQLKNSDDSMLTGLPAGNYLFLGGSVADPKVSAQVMNDFLGPIQTVVQDVGPDAKPISDYLSALNSIVSNQSGSTFAMIQPQGELGTVPLVQFITIARGDSKTLLAGEQQLLNSQQDLMKLAGNNIPSPMKTTYTPAAKTVGGVTFDQFHTQLDPAQAQMIPPQAQMVMNFMYGQDGMSAYMGAVDDQTMLLVAGASDDYLASAVTSVKANDATVGQQQGIINTAGHLPKQRAVVMYIPLDTLVNTIFGYSAKFGFDPGIQFPATDPIGVTLSTQGTAIREDGYVPVKVISGIVDAAHKLQHTGGPGAGPGGPPGPGGPGGPPPPGGL